MRPGQRAERPRSIAAAEEAQGACTAVALHRCFRNTALGSSEPSPRPSKPVRPVLPRTLAARLSQPDARITPSSSGELIPGLPAVQPPAIKADAKTAAPPSADTVLYLAYGSNLCAQTFQGSRGIRPISAVNVSVPSLRLTFDLPGLPYIEPCFANTAPREIPKPPVPVPIPVPKPNPPKIPDLPSPPPQQQPYGYNGSEGKEGGEEDIQKAVVQRNAAGDPVWTRGLIGVVYEITREDYAKIIATEGGGASYQDILVPCFPLQAASSSSSSTGLPDLPDIPLPPRPFLAHTLYAPRLPDVPSPPPESDQQNSDDGDDGNDRNGTWPPAWMHKLLLPVRRPDPTYAQPSARYLNLIRDGAAEHSLPAAYRAYLAALQAYEATTARQRVGQVVFLVCWAPVLLLLLGVERVIADRQNGGRVPYWCAATAAVVFNLVWVSYDTVARPVFGDGERRQEDGDGERRQEDGDGDDGEDEIGDNEEEEDEEKSGEDRSLLV